MRQLVKGKGVRSRSGRVPGEILYKGKSRLDGKTPIVAILTCSPTGNRKIGDYVMQTWILVQGKSPIEAVTSGKDSAVCGGCQLRPFLRKKMKAKGIEPPTKQPCYVTTFMAPGQVWRSWKNGSYSKEPIALPKNFKLRLGAYGDPAAVPMAVWAALIMRLREANRVDKRLHVGYTRQWETFQDVAEICMASVFSETERERAKALGFRTFRIRGKDDPLLQNEFACPASAEEDNRLTCEGCMACNGSGGVDDGRADVSIIAH